MRLRGAFLGLVGALGIGAAAFAYFSWEPAIPLRATPQQASPDKTLVARGAQLAAIGNCQSCHTAERGAPYAGGRPIETPFGTIHATNITPDPDTGIGRWSEAAFLRAMREGVRVDGAHLYPAFPYDHFTKVSIADLQAIYAFVMTREPVRAEAPPNTVPFPLSQRALIAGWKLLYFTAGEFKSDPTLSAQSNRGAYLVDGLAHCGACHTPRNGLGAERNDHYLSGGDAEGWHAPALNAASTAPVPWTSDQLLAYLRNGFVEPHGVAAGPMRSVVNNLAGAAEPDVEAIAAYVGALVGPPTAGRAPKAPAPFPHAESQSQSGSRALTTRDAITSADGAIIYAGACAPCHEASGQRFSARGIHLASSKVVTMPDARNLARVTLYGITPPAASPAAQMPGFADVLTNEQIVALMGYLRRTFSDQAPWSELEAVVRDVRRSASGS